MLGVNNRELRKSQILSSVSSVGAGSPNLGALLRDVKLVGRMALSGSPLAYLRTD